MKKTILATLAMSFMTCLGFSAQVVINNDHNPILNISAATFGVVTDGADGVTPSTGTGYADYEGFNTQGASTTYTISGLDLTAVGGTTDDSITYTVNFSGTAGGAATEVTQQLYTKDTVDNTGSLISLSLSSQNGIDENKDEVFFASIGDISSSAGFDAKEISVEFVTLGFNAFKNTEKADVVVGGVTNEFVGNGDDVYDFPEGTTSFSAAPTVGAYRHDSISYKISVTNMVGVKVSNFSVSPTTATSDETSLPVSLSWLAFNLDAGATYVVTADKAVSFVDPSSGSAVSGLTEIGATFDGSLGDVEFTMVVDSGVESITNIAVISVHQVAISLDEDFATGYSDGDLAEQKKWTKMTPSNAFNVVTSAGGSAETMSVSNEFDGVNGTAVYWSDSVNNATSTEWTGSVSFVMSVASKGSEKERVINGATSSFPVANLTDARNVVEIGFTADTAGGFNASDANDVVLGLRCSNQREFKVRFGQDCVTIPLEDIGWDPNWEAVDENGQPTVSGPDFETDPLTVDYWIRKSTVDGLYIANVNVTVGGETYEGSARAISASSAYDAAGVNFVMAHSMQADGSTDLNLVHGTVNYLGLETVAGTPIPMFAPYGLNAVSPGSLMGDISWNGAWEADSISLYRSSDESILGTEVTNVAAGVDTYADTFVGADAGNVFFYTAVANYGVDSTNSNVDALRVLQETELAGWGRSTEIVTAHQAFLVDWDTSVSNQIAPGEYLFNSIATGVGGLIVDSSWYNAAASPELYGMFQRVSSTSTNSDTCKFSNTGRGMRNDVSFGGTDDSMQLGIIDSDDVSGIPKWSGLVWFEDTGLSSSADGDSIYEIELPDWDNSVRMAIRNGSDWYVNDTTFDGADTFKVKLSDASWALVEVATATSTNLMTAGASFAPQTFDNITAVGFFVDNKLTLGGQKINYFGLINATYVSPFAQWTDDHGLYGDDAAADADPDGDEVSNINEWGFGGDPNDAENLGITERGFGVDSGSGTLTYIYPRLKSDPRPTYTLTENTVGLQFDSFVDNESAYTIITNGGEWVGESNFEAVTNIVPVDVAKKFLKLEVTE
ncbi:hypothetical protein [Pontiella sulfatireligans]|uniref:Uncharacterized protein n=1 Tax=Pontiella sulfatireligans TaxID=2750658 RepID=A0A6C2UR10_9BACT|nr:hypothetical protein [Pontiella sulfatireligans]VGO22668.1 hypothetical protein SCARR_04763 [Pontiella sulfatireligans]